MCEKYKLYKYETCPKCDGHGKDRVFHGRWGAYDYSGPKCGRCEGSGVIRVIWGEIEKCVEKDSIT